MLGLPHLSQAAEQESGGWDTSLCGLVFISPAGAEVTGRGSSPWGPPDPGLRVPPHPLPWFLLVPHSHAKPNASLGPGPSPAPLQGGPSCSNRQSWAEQGDQRGVWELFPPAALSRALVQRIPALGSVHPHSAVSGAPRAWGPSWATHSGSCGTWGLC